MFTGLVEEMGRVEAVEEIPDGRRFRISAPHALDDLKRGDSLAISGVCQTIVDIEGGPAAPQRTTGQEGGPPKFAATVIAIEETLRRTTFGRLHPGSIVNLERPLRMGDRLGGHWVSGHVDGVGTIRELRANPADWAVQIAVPASLAPYLIEKGSVSVDGVSLTVGTVDDKEDETHFWVYIIPETRERTLFGQYETGDPVNIETDLLGKYVLRARELAARVS